MLRVLVTGMICLLGSYFYIGDNSKAYPQSLSGWELFEGKMALLQPKKGVVPYSLNTPLYSDYAEKSRMIRLPKGGKVSYQSKGVLQFPVGTLLIKTFYYPEDFSSPGKNLTLVETRLLIKEEVEWKALTYVWNEAQTEAVLEIAGDDRQIHFIDPAGRQQEVRYVVPNQNQCKGCHSYNDLLMPIGPSVAQLNGQLQYREGKFNQLEYWKRNGMLDQLPALSEVPAMAVWNDPATGSLDARARAYLDINCAHCHRREGPAQTSGLYLTADEQHPTALGINKSPVAAGKGSGGRMVDILPGDANGSILWYRMLTSNPGERMPELGRNMAHAEGLALIKNWIDHMK